MTNYHNPQEIKVGGIYWYEAVIQTILSQSCVRVLVSVEKVSKDSVDIVLLTSDNSVLTVPKTYLFEKDVS